MGLLDLLLGSNSKPYSKMSDKELARDLRRGQDKNTGESVATRAKKIMEAEKRNLDWKPKK